MTALASNPRAAVLPSHLSQAQRRGMFKIGEGRSMYRRAGGYGLPPRGVSLDVASSLVGLGLVHIDHQGGPHLAFTGAGRDLHAVMAERRQRSIGA